MKLRAFPSLDTAPPPELTLLAPQPGSMDRVALYATTSGTLFSATWSQAANAPVAGTVTPLGAAGSGWASRAMFFYQAAP